MMNNKRIELQANKLHKHLFNSLTKKVAIGVVALGLIAPIASQSLQISSPVNITVNARRRHRRHYRKHYKRHYYRRTARKHHVSYNWRLANKLHRNTSDIYDALASDNYFADGINDGNVNNRADGALYSALINMDNVNNSDATSRHNYKLGWLYSHADDYNKGYDQSTRTTRGYWKSLNLWNQGVKYGNNTGNEYLYYDNGADDTGYDPNTGNMTDTGVWMPATTPDNESGNQNNMGELIGHYKPMYY